MTAPLAIIPARVGSKGVPGKNFTPIHGRSLVQRAVDCANEAGVGFPILTTDEMWTVTLVQGCSYLPRPSSLAQDDTPMIDVVRHVLDAVPGPGDQVVVLLQPTSALRTPEHIRLALAMLEEPWTSVVSVVPVPRMYSPDLVCVVRGADLVPSLCEFVNGPPEWDVVTRRQDAVTGYRRDGTVYVTTRGSIARSGNLYGDRVCPFILPASESLTVDTPEDWAEAERRLR